jgi:hypothetical protein
MNREMQEKIEIVSARAKEDPLFMERLAHVGRTEELEGLCAEMGISATRSEAEEGMILLRENNPERMSYQLSDEQLERIAAGGETPKNCNPTPSNVLSPTY